MGAKRNMLDPVLHAWRRPIVQSNFKQDHLYNDHDARLQEQRVGIVRAKPIKDPYEFLLLAYEASNAPS